MYDLIIVGSGVAGLSAAITANERKLKTLLISKESEEGQGNSRYAQGGIVFTDPEDETLRSDFKVASSGTANMEIVDIIQKQSPKILEHELLELSHTPFERDLLGNLKFTKEAAHSIPRILFKGDYSGRAITESMDEYLRANSKTVEFLTGARVFKINVKNNRAIGVSCVMVDNSEVRVIKAKKIILATGGCASLYSNTTNYVGALGDGMGLVSAAGGNLKGLEFIQFHPTTLFLPHSTQRFLISEAVRGEGALLRNCNGERFVDELLSRDRVAKAIVDEIKKTNHPCVYLSLEKFSEDFFKNRFPTIWQKLVENHIDAFKTGIPVVPSAHFTCGGIEVNKYGEVSNIENLYAIGECANNGLHGANRLASTALLEGLTFGSVVVSALIFDDEEFEIEEELFDTTFVDLKSNYDKLGKLLWAKAGLLRNDDDLRSGLEELQNMKIDNSANNPWLQVFNNNILVAESIFSSSLNRAESLGCFSKIKT